MPCVIITISAVCMTDDVRLGPRCGAISARHGAVLSALLLLLYHGTACHVVVITRHGTASTAIYFYIVMLLFF